MGVEPRGGYSHMWVVWGGSAVKTPLFERPDPHYWGSFFPCTRSMLLVNSRPLDIDIFEWEAARPGAFFGGKIPVRSTHRSSLKEEELKDSLRSLYLVTFACTFTKCSTKGVSFSYGMPALLGIVFSFIYQHCSA